MGLDKNQERRGTGSTQRLQTQQLLPKNSMKDVIHSQKSSCLDFKKEESSEAAIKSEYHLDNDNEDFNFPLLQSGNQENAADIVNLLNEIQNDDDVLK